MTENLTVHGTHAVEDIILTVRGQKVILDCDLARIYGVPTKRLNEQVRRNADRFPPYFAFQLASQEVATLRSQIVTSKSDPRSGTQYPPMAFTEQGVAMLSSVLNSERAVQVNIAIMRAFVQLRNLLSTHADLARKLAKKYDTQFRVVFDAIRQLMTRRIHRGNRLDFKHTCRKPATGVILKGMVQIRKESRNERNGSFRLCLNPEQASSLYYSCKA